MVKTITVTFADDNLQILERWLNMSQTLNMAMQACKDAGTEMLAAEIENYKACSDELKVLIPAIEYMHKQIQQQLWVTKANGSDMFITTVDGEHTGPDRWYANVKQLGLRYVGYGDTSAEAVDDLKKILAKEFPEVHWYQNLPVIQVN